MIKIIRTFVIGTFLYGLTVGTSFGKDDLNKTVYALTYNAPTSTVEFFDPAPNKNISGHDLLRLTLDDIITSNLLNKKYIPELEELIYRLEIDENESLLGKFENMKNLVIFYLNSFPKDIDISTTRYNLINTGIHEIAHKFWDDFISEQDKAEFTDNIHIIKERYDKINEMLNKKEGVDKKKILGMYEFTKEEYDNFSNFICRKSTYQNRYGDYFDKFFWGTEAFSYLIQFELSNKLSSLSIKKVADKFNIYELKLEREYVEEELKEIHSIPKELLSFYKGFIADRYIE
ncbi:hypothetical protein GOV08_01575 [Candidatus Woesearchaeota archaeon]|nr:hypothetical protein [Candidatus Woesearchaeota archaeon]